MIDRSIAYEVRDGVAFVTLRRPEKLNALTSDMAAALADAWTRLEADDTARVAVLRGEGPAFCAGADLLADGPDHAPAGQLPLRLRMAQAVPKNGVRVFKPIIGCVRGYALGIGYALAVKGCDITIAGESTLLGYPEGVAGIAQPPIDYVPYLPFKQSLEFALLAWKNGRLVDAKRALGLGLVNAVVADEDLESEALRWADLLKQLPPLYIKSVKYGHYKSIDTARAQMDRDFLDYVRPQETSAEACELRERFAARQRPSA